MKEQEWKTTIAYLSVDILIHKKTYIDSPAGAFQGMWGTMRIVDPEKVTMPTEFGKERGLNWEKCWNELFEKRFTQSKGEHVDDDDDKTRRHAQQSLQSLGSWVGNNSAPHLPKMVVVLAGSTRNEICCGGFGFISYLHRGAFEQSKCEGLGIYLVQRMWMY